MGRYYETFNPPFFLDLSFLHDNIADNPKGFDRDPASILEEMNLGLSRLRSQDRSNVMITVKDQVVSISGTVPSTAVSKYIANVADKVLGVRYVKNDLQIHRAGGESNPQNKRQAQFPLKNRPASDSLSQDKKSSQIIV
jgi:hypothetical protein